MKTTEATQPSTKEQHINPYDIQNRRTTSPNTPRNKKSSRNQKGITIPSIVIELMELQAKDKLKLEFDGKKIIITKED